MSFLHHIKRFFKIFNILVIIIISSGIIILLGAVQHVHLILSLSISLPLNFDNFKSYIAVTTELY